MECNASIHLNSFKKILKELQLDGAIINSPENFFYFVGLASHQHTVTRSPNLATLLVSNHDTFCDEALVMDFELPRFNDINHLKVSGYDTWVGRKTLQALKSNNNVGHEKKSMHDHVKARIDCEGLCIGLELDLISVTVYHQLCELLPNVSFVNISPKIVELRSVKTQEEIDAFRELIKVQDLALSKTLSMIKVGVSELEIAQLFNQAILGFNVEGSQWSMFSSGINSSYLGLPSNNLVKSGDLFKFDGGVNAKMSFYTTDFARTWFIDSIDPELMTLKLCLYEAQRLMIKSIRPGITCSELFKIGFDYVKAKYPNYERGHLGHSISLGPSTWEAPLISLSDHTIIKAGMIFCIEVPCYLDGIGGFNLEDMVLVTDNGSEVLSNITDHFSLLEKEFLKSR